MPNQIIINGKFLNAPLNGVHRVARKFSDGLLSQAAAAGVPASVVAPPKSATCAANTTLNPRAVGRLAGSGQFWEMAALPIAARKALLLNFCNLSPVLHGNSVVMIHDAQTFMYPADYTGRQAAAYRALLPWIGRRARRVLTVSEYARRRLAEYRIAPLDKIEVVHNGTDHILDVPPDPHVLATHHLQKGEYVLAVGSAKGYKNMARVFAACQALGVQLVVAGGPNEAAYRSRGATPPNHTIFTGFVSDAALRSLYEHAALFFFPSLTEGFGLPAVEAMQCGCPVLAAQAGAMPEVCADAAAYADPHDTDAWCEIAQEILSDHTRAEAMRAKGFERARTLSWDAAHHRLWSILEPLVA